MVSKGKKVKHMKKLAGVILDIFCFIAENLAVIGGIALIAMMLLTIADVVLRRFGSTVIGNVELLCYIMCVIVFLGFGKATFINCFTKVEIFDFKKAEPFVKVFMDIVHFVMCAFASYFCFIQSMQTRKMGTTSPRLEIPRWPFVFLSGIGFLLITISIPLVNYKKHKNKDEEKKLANKEVGGNTM